MTPLLPGAIICTGGSAIQPQDRGHARVVLGGGQVGNLIPELLARDPGKRRLGKQAA